MCLYSLVCVAPGRKRQRQVFPRRGSFVLCFAGVKSAFTVILPTEGLTKNTARFMKAITNEGGHYNTTTGIFTCVYPGIYVFALQILNKNNGDYVTCNIRKNKISKSVEALSNDKGGYFSSSTFAVIHLARGDEVDVKCRSIATINQSWSSFSGFLTQADRY